jgi:hypothetical protein
VCTDTNRASEGYIPSFDPNMLVWNNKIAKGVSGVLKDTCQFDDRRDAHVHLSNSNLVKFKNPLLFQKRGHPY